MPNYPATQLPELLKISSITSVFRTRGDLSKTEKIEEALPFQEFVHVEKGEINILSDGEVFFLRPGNIIFYPPNSIRSIVTSRDAVLNVVCFESASPVLSEFFGEAFTLSDTQSHELSKIISLGETLFTAAPTEKYKGGMVARKDASMSSLQRLGNMIEIFLLGLYENHGANPEKSAATREAANGRFLLLMDYLRNRVSENPTLEEMALACRTSVSGLHRLCKKVCGLSPVALFISLKIGEAKRLMTQTSLNISEISEALGFSSIHYFSKLFKAKTGITPSEYSRNASAI